MNAKRIKLLLIALVVLLATVSVSAQSPEYYNKHFVILVDQTPDVQKHKNMKVLYDAICAFLRGEDDVVEKYGLDASLSDLSDVPKNIKFDEKNDQISLFSFGIVGAYKYGRYTGDYATIHSLSQYRGTPSADVYDKIVKSLIHERKSFQASNLTFDAYLENVMRPMFYGEDQTAIDIRENSGVTMSHYIYPCLLQFLDKKVGASEYYILVVTNYKSGTAQSDSEDEKILQDMLGASSSGNPHLKYFHQTKQKIGKPFYETPFVKLVKSDMSNDNPYIEGKRLWLMSLQGTSVQINNNVEFVQKGYGSDEYDLNPVEVLFTHDNTLEVQKIVLELTDLKSGTTEKHGICDNSDECRELKTKNIYSLPGNTFKLSDMEVGDSLMVSYVFYTMTKDEGKALIPYIYKAERCFVFDENAFAAPLSPRNNSKILIILVLLIVFVALLVFLLYRWLRAKYQKGIDVELHITPAKNKYMDVSGNTVADYPCWYYDGVNRQYAVNVQGLIIQNHKIAKDTKYRVEYRVNDIDQDDNFTFRPQGENPDGSQYRPDQDIRCGVDDNGFSFTILAYIDDEVMHGQDPDLVSIDHIIKMEIVAKVLVDDKEVKTEKVKYDLIVKPRIENPDLWMGIDPGTTGSCISYGRTGNVTDRDDIALAYNEKKHNNIFPSVVRIPDNSRIFNQEVVDVTKLDPETDFEYGNIAEDRLRNGNGFQSIKKLLGYTASQSIRSRNGKIVNISGQDLAHLLVKGLYKQFETYINTNNKVNENIRRHFCSNGYFRPQRICVAVPNNYTLVKVQDMVDSVKRLNVFKEVHYIYESEAVMMNYIREEWSNICANTEKAEGRTYLVYDMGGATINVTAFKLKPVLMYREGVRNINYIEVETISKIGYCVGGDDIDYAIIQMIYNIPTVDKALKEIGYDGKEEEHQRENKTVLIELARKIKLDWIAKLSGKEKEGNVTIDRNSFWQCLRNYLPEELGKIVGKIRESENYNEVDDNRYIDNELRSRSNMDRYVLSYVRDSINEVVDRLGKDVVLIMSGRSVLYPGIKENVVETLEKAGKQVDLWNGFNSADGSMDDELVKTAVAKGACWYSMYCSKIKLVNNIVTSSFGYIDMAGGNPIFIPLINKYDKFDEAGKIRNIRNGTIADLNDMKFVQMLGSNYSEILDDKNVNVRNLKMNCIDSIPNTVLANRVRTIEVTFDNLGNFEYDVCMEGVDKHITKKNNPDSRIIGGAVRTEIVDENNLSYMFAAYTPVDENAESATRVSDSPENRSVNKGTKKTRN